MSDCMQPSVLGRRSGFAFVPFRVAAPRPRARRLIHHDLPCCSQWYNWEIMLHMRLAMALKKVSSVRRMCLGQEEQLFPTTAQQPQ